MFVSAVTSIIYRCQQGGRAKFVSVSKHNGVIQIGFSRVEERGE